MLNKKEITLLTEGQIWGNRQENQLEVLKKYGTKVAVTDLVILTGGYVSDYYVPDDNSLSGRTGWSWTQSSDGAGDVRVVYRDGDRDCDYRYIRNGAVRPALLPSSVTSQISSNRVRGYNGTEEILFGEYPQMAVSHSEQESLERLFNRNLLTKTGKTYTFDSRMYDDYDNGFQAVSYEEYTYSSKKYIRIKANSWFDGSPFKLSNGREYRDGDYVWVEVSPIRWLYDTTTRTMVSKKALVSGIRFDSRQTRYDGNFSRTEMYNYMNTYMVRDMFQNIKKVNTELSKEEQLRIARKKNPYNLEFDEVSEEDIIMGAIESGVAVFLHGPSSEGKSARVKQIDPNCEIIYLRNATPESLNGKSVYDASTGKMIDVPPTWFKKISAKCEQEPDKLHIVFLDEITNALPSIQGIAFNIVLDREVNGIWQLPDNARIVAAGNDMNDSLAANQLAEPLFNRFAHVYIKTTVNKWLDWASTHGIHPAIYAYIAYKKEDALRSKYTGEKPNADPRKWEMASKMLYRTGKPEMLRALVGEEITREFIEFCNQRVITLTDVINDRYDEQDLEMNTSEKYATTIGLTQVDEINFLKVRAFVERLGAEFVAIFDSLWIRDNEERMEKIAELRLQNLQEGGRK